MKIVVTASGTDLDSPVDPRFGRCQYFIFVDSDSLQFEAIENENVLASGGAGIQSVQFVVQKGAEAVITGNLGPNASTAFSNSNIKVFLGASGTIREAIQMFKNGQLQEAFGPSVQAHFGMGQQPGSGPSTGFGPGMGMGMGRGMGRGMGMMSSPPAPSQPMSKEQEIQMLKEQTRVLEEQLKMIGQRIEELGK
jgi:predicted Fe-Mo cluster-binding NifX family protein